MRQSLQKVILIGLFAALVFTSTMLRVELPLTYTMVHCGNIVCIVCGVLLEPLYAGLAAGLGSFLFDLSNPLFIASAPFSFIFKFLLAFISSKIYRLKKIKIKFFPKVILAGTLGSLIYMTLHTFKSLVYNLYFLNIPLSAVIVIAAKRLFVSLINAIISVLASTLILKKLKNIGVLH